MRTGKLQTASAVPQRSLSAQTRSGEIWSLAVDAEPEGVQGREQLESLLARAPVISQEKTDHHTRSREGIYVAWLAGDLPAFWKRGDVDPPGAVGVKREVAAYELAKILGWDDLLQVTVLREEPAPDGSTALIASIELLPEGDEHVAATDFPQGDIERAAVFDALIANSDRGGHNWRGVRSAANQWDLKLYDHEMAFQVGGALNSSFWNAIGRGVPAHLQAHLAASAEAIRASAILQTLLPEPEHQELLQRLERLASNP